MSRLGDSPGWPYSEQRKTGAIAQTASFKKEIYFELS